MPTGPGELSVSHVVEGDQHVVLLKGELDVASAGRLADLVSELRPLSSPLAVDVTDVTFLDSAGLRALLAVRQEVLGDTGETLRLRGVNDEQYKLLELCGLVDAFGVTAPGA